MSLITNYSFLSEDGLFFLIGLVICIVIVVSICIVYVSHILSRNNIKDKSLLFRLPTEFLFSVIILIVNIILAIYLTVLTLFSFISVGSLVVLDSIILLILVVILLYYVKTTTNNASIVCEKMVNYVESLEFKDITLDYYKEIIEISQNTLDNGLCKLINEMAITNHMNESYKYFRYEIRSSSKVSKKYDVYLDDEHIDMKKGLKYTRSQIKSCNCNEMKCDICNSPNEEISGELFRFDIPVGIKENKTRKLRIEEEQCPCLDKLRYSINETASCECSNRSLETFSYRVKWHTVELKYIIRLDDSLKKQGYMIVRGNEPDDMGEFDEFKVTDMSDQRMGMYEKYLIEHGLTPRYKNSDKQEYIWTIPSPKTTYSYHIYFTIVKKK